MSRKPTTANRLTAARDELAAVQARISELGRERAEALLDDRDADAKALAIQLDELAQTERGLQDKVRLLVEKQESEEQNERRAEHEAKIDKVEMLCTEYEKAGRELSRSLKQTDTAFRRMWRIGRAIRDAWDWTAGEQSSLRIGDHDLVRMLESEIFRIGYRPPATGGMLPTKVDGPSFPGWRAPRIEWLGMPSAVPPLVADLKQISAWATSTLRGQPLPAPPTEPATSPNGEIPHSQRPEAAEPQAEAVIATPQGNGDVNPYNVRAPSPTTLSRSGKTLGQLYAEQSRLSEIPEQSEEIEREYQQVLAEISELMETAA